LYYPNKADFSELHEPLQLLFEKAERVFTFNLQKPRKLARLSWVELQRHLADPGYYLQLPPKPPNLLDEHLQQQG